MFAMTVIKNSFIPATPKRFTKNFTQDKEQATIVTIFLPRCSLSRASHIRTPFLFSQTSTFNTHQLSPKIVIIKQ